MFVALYEKEIIVMTLGVHEILGTNYCTHSFVLLLVAQFAFCFVVITALIFMEAA